MFPCPLITVVPLLVSLMAYLLLGDPKHILFFDGSHCLVLLPCNLLGSSDASFDPIVSFMAMFSSLATSTRVALSFFFLLLFLLFFFYPLPKDEDPPLVLGSVGLLVMSLFLRTKGFQFFLCHCRGPFMVGFISKGAFSIIKERVA